MKKNPPRAIGGFGDNPENINRNGRPKKGYSITEIFRDELSKEPSRKRAIFQVILTKALEGDLSALKLIWSYMDGMPRQNIGLEDTSDYFNKIEIEIVNGNKQKDNSTKKTQSD